MTLVWIITGVIAWILTGTLAGILIGRIGRGRDQQTPSPNHPTMRAHRQLTDDRPPDSGPPLTPRETAALDQLQEQLR